MSFQHLSASVTCNSYWPKKNYNTDTLKRLLTVGRNGGGGEPQVIFTITFDIGKCQIFCAACSSVPFKRSWLITAPPINCLFLTCNLRFWWLRLSFNQPKFEFLIVILSSIPLSQLIPLKPGGQMHNPGMTQSPPFMQCGVHRADGRKWTSNEHREHKERSD